MTDHLLDALYSADDADGDGRVTARETKEYLDERMTRAAKRKFRRIQEASLMGVEEAVLVELPPEGSSQRPAFHGDVAPRIEGGSEEVAPSHTEKAKAAKAALALIHAQRVLMQRGLAVLGHGVGHPDGILGKRREWRRRAT